MNKIIVITGITGQLSFYLSKLLLEQGHTVVGTMRRTSSPTDWRLKDLPDNLRSKLIIREADITDYSSIVAVLKEFNPDWFINTAAMSYVHHSFKAPLATFEITGLGALNCLDAVRQHCPDCKFLTCSSSEMFGNRAIGDKERSEVKEIYQSILDESSGFAPRSIYGVAKLAAHNAVDNYRKAYDMWAIAPIMFNYESPYRGVEFVTRKITNSIASILAGQQEYIKLGNLEAYRDWSHCEDFARGILLMMEQDKPIDYVLSSGETHSIREFLDIAFDCVGIKDWSIYIKTDPEFIRAADIDVLIGSSAKARQELGWQPAYSFKQLVYEMMYRDCLRKGVVDKMLLSKGDTKF